MRKKAPSGIDYTQKTWKPKPRVSREHKRSRIFSAPMLSLKEGEALAGAGRRMEILRQQMQASPTVA